MKNIYQPFLDKIASTIGSHGQIQKSLNESLAGIKNYFEKSEKTYSNFTGDRAISAAQQPAGINNLARLVGLKFQIPTLGNHPDFVHIGKTYEPENHYATAVFQDIKGSTSLFKKYPKEQVYIIVQTISTATTHTHALFTGHIQRLQYDGVFSYFVRKNQSEKLATFYSLCATAFSNYFIRYELRNYFNSEHGFDNIYSKTGIDYGAKDDVMWVAFGVNGCSEVSTNSLHTSLAFKIQAEAYSDKICVGGNVVALFPELNEYFTPHTKSDGTIENIIFENQKENFSYRYYDFHWESFLSTLFSDFVKRDNSGKLFIDYDYNELTVDRIANLRWKNILTKIGLGAIDNKGSFVRSSNNDLDIKQNRIPNSGFYADEL